MVLMPWHNPTVSEKYEKEKFTSKKIFIKEIYFITS